MDVFKLIALYYYICKCYNKELRWHCERFSPNNSPIFTDEELLTIYLFCVSEEEKYKIKSIHSFAKKYLLDWFPHLPSYQTFNDRLNRLAPVFPPLISNLLRDMDYLGVSWDISLLDSMPIITCSGKRAGKVASELTDKGYCSTKKLHYYGAKLHAIAFLRKGSLPLPEFFSLTSASEHDLNAVREILPTLKGRAVIGDKAYSNKDFTKVLEMDHSVFIYTPIKLVKGESQSTRQFKYAADKLFSTSVSRLRQPIESLFNWLIEKTDIQRASKVRSTKGLIVHVFGRIASALSIWIF